MAIISGRSVVVKPPNRRRLTKERCWLSFNDATAKAKKGDEKGAKIEEKKVLLRILDDILCCDRIGRGEMTSCMPSSHL